MERKDPYYTLVGVGRDLADYLLPAFLYWDCDSCLCKQAPGSICLWKLAASQGTLPP